MCRECGQHQASVLETRNMHRGTVIRRMRGCICGARYNTYEIDDGIWPTVKKWAVSSRTKTIEKRQALHQRNQEIIARLRAGERACDLTAIYKLSPSTISLIRQYAELPPARKVKLRNPWAGL